MTKTEVRRSQETLKFTPTTLNASENQNGPEVWSIKKQGKKKGARREKEIKKIYVRKTEEKVQEKVVKLSKVIVNNEPSKLPVLKGRDWEDLHMGQKWYLFHIRLLPVHVKYGSELPPRPT